MTNATFTTLLSTEITNEYGNTYRVSLMHRSAGLHAVGSAFAKGAEVWMVRVQKAGESTFGGAKFTDKLAALDAYNAKVGTFVTTTAA